MHLVTDDDKDLLLLLQILQSNYVLVTRINHSVVRNSICSDCKILELSFKLINGKLCHLVTYLEGALV